MNLKFQVLKTKCLLLQHLTLKYTESFISLLSMQIKLIIIIITDIFQNDSENKNLKYLAFSVILQGKNSL